MNDRLQRGPAAGATEQRTVAEAPENDRLGRGPDATDRLGRGPGEGARPARVQRDPLAQGPVLIEDVERERAAARRLWAPTLPDIEVDVAAVAVVLGAVAVVLAVAGIVAIPQAPGVLRPYSMTVRLVLLAALLGGVGGVLLRLARTYVSAGGPHGSDQETRSRTQ